jgi:K+ transporter
MVLTNSLLNHSFSFQYVILLNFRGSLSFKTCCYGINLFQVVIITTILLATFYVDVYLFVIAAFAFFKLMLVLLFCMDIPKINDFDCKSYKEIWIVLELAWL